MMTEYLAELEELRLADYFDVVSADEIRIRGTRVGIETVIEESQRGRSAEEIASDYPALSLEQIHATLTLYHHHEKDIEAYMRRWKAHGEQMLAVQEKRFPEFTRQLRRSRGTRGDSGAQ